MEKLHKILVGCDTKIQVFFSKKWHYAITIPGLLVLLYTIYLVFCFKTGPYDSTIAGHQSFGLRNDVCFYAFQWIGLSLLLLIIIYLVFEIIFGIMKTEKFVKIILLISCICLVCYGFTMSIQGFGQEYDTIPFVNYGHWSVIAEIYKTNTIPAAQLGNQYYHPKLFHTTMAIFMRFNSLFLNIGEDVAVQDVAIGKYLYDWTVTDYQLMEMNRILMAFIGIYSLIFLKKIMKLLLIDGIKYGAAASIILLVPGLWYTPFYCNNDSIAFFFTIIALWSVILYFKMSKWWSLALCAISIGLGMMTKTNATLISIPIAILFLYKFIRIIKSKDSISTKMFILHMMTFAVMVFPLGLWCPIYYKIKYNIPIGYVLEIKPDGPTWINQDFYNPFQRFIAYPALDLFRAPYVRMWRSQDNTGHYYDEYGSIDYNIWSGYIKTLCFYGQVSPGWMVNTKAGFAPLQLLLFLYVHLYYLISIVVFLIALISSIFFFIKKMMSLVKTKTFHFAGVNYLLLAIALAYIIGFIYFNWRYPFGVTQHSRYALPLLIPVFCSFGYLCQFIADKIKFKRRIIAKAEEIAARQENKES